MLNAESSFGNAYEILDGDATMLEFFVSEENEVTGMPISQLRMRGRTIICAIARDDVVHRLAGYEVVVHVAGHLAPDGERLAVVDAAGLGHAQAAVALATIGQPLDAQLRLLALLQGALELIGIGVPGSTPAFGHHLFAVNIYLNISGVVEDELVDVGPLYGLRGG